jgi:hypothetical protein
MKVKEFVDPSESLAHLFLDFLPKFPVLRVLLRYEAIPLAAH